MKNQTIEKKCESASSIYQSFMIDSIGEFTDECNPFDVIRSLGRLRREWIKPEASPLIFEHIHAIESLLVNISEADAKYNQLICDSYEQE